MSITSTRQENLHLQEPFPYTDILMEKDYSSSASYFKILYSGEKYSDIWLSSRFKDGEFVEDHIISTKFNVKTGEYHKKTLEENGSRHGFR